MRSSRLCLPPFVDKPATTCAQLLITKKPVDFDYVAVDASGLVGGALRLSKNANSEQRRHSEVARHVVQGIQQLLKRVNCRFSLLIALDGPEPLAKAAVARTAAQTRRLESRLQRLPGTALMQAVEERLVRMMPARAFLPREVVIAGTCAQGSVEEKMAAWALDLAAREDFNSNNSAGGGSGPSLTFVGAQDLYMLALAATPYYAVSSLVQGVGVDVRQISLSSLLQWLGLEELAAAGRSRAVARARTDAAFLLLLCGGSSSTELAAVGNLRFGSVFAAYHQLVLGATERRGGKGNRNTNDSTNANSSSGGGGGDDAAAGELDFLFADVPGNRLELNTDTLAGLLALTVPGATAAAAKNDPRAGSYLELALQSHASLCLGRTPDPLYLPPALSLLASSSSGGVGGGSALSVTPLQLYTHLLFLKQYRRTSRLCATESPATAAAATATVASPPTPLIEAAAVDDVAAVAVTVADDAAPAPTDAVETGAAAVSTADPTLAPPAPPPPLYDPFYSPTQPLTAAEYTVLCHGTTPGIEAALQLYLSASGSGSGLVQPLPELPKRIAQADAGGALILARRALSLASAQRPHRCVCFSPSYCWTQGVRSKLWRMAYVDLGERGAAAEVRRRRNDLSGVSMAARASVEGPAAFCAERRRWEPVLQFPCGGGEDEGGASAEAAARVVDGVAADEAAQPHGASSTPAPPPPPPPPPTPSVDSGRLKVLTWNVMFDRYSGQPTPLGMPGIDWCSPQRYPVLARLIAAEDADVVGLQEVEPAFLAYLAAQPWCRERYLLSCTPGSAVLSPWGIAMLVHRRRRGCRIDGLTHVNVPAWSGHTSLMPIVTLRMRHGPVQVAAIHLLAPFTKNNENARTAQDQALRHRLTKGMAGGGGSDCIAMGDYNDWPTNKFDMPADTQYRECWPLVHPKDLGNTMDETNTFCKLKIEEIFFGRADKVFLRSQRLLPVEAHLVGIRSVNAENGNTDAPGYLFPSDHYGVSMTFSL